MTEFEEILSDKVLKLFSEIEYLKYQLQEKDKEIEFRDGEIKYLETMLSLKDELISRLIKEDLNAHR